MMKEKYDISALHRQISQDNFEINGMILLNWQRIYRASIYDMGHP